MGLPCWTILALSWPILGHLARCSNFLFWAILALCWPILGHVARWCNLTPSNFLQIILIYFFLHISKLQITLPTWTAPWWLLMWAFVCSLWGHRCVGLSWGMLRDAEIWLLAILRKGQLFNVIWSVFCTFQHWFWSKSLQITLRSPIPPMALADKRIIVSNTFRYHLAPPTTPHASRKQTSQRFPRFLTKLLWSSQI